MIYQDHFKENYNELIEQIKNILPSKQLGYISLGVVRFTKDVYHEVEKNYPDSPITKQDYIKSFDNKVRYNLPMRMWMMNSVKDMLCRYYPEEKIYLCMED